LVSISPSITFIVSLVT